MFSSCFHLWHQLAITLTVWTPIQRWVQEICSHAVHFGAFLTLQLYLFMYNFLKFNLSLMSTNAPRCTELSCLWSFLWFNERIRGYGVYPGEYGLKSKQFKACLSDCSSLEEFHSVRVNFFCSYIFFLYVCARVCVGEHWGQLCNYWDTQHSLQASHAAMQILIFSCLC